MELSEVLLKRRSVRKFSAEPVSEEAIDALMHAASSAQAPHLVGASSIFFNASQARRLIHSAAPPLPTDAALRHRREPC